MHGAKKVIRFTHLLIGVCFIASCGHLRDTNTGLLVSRFPDFQLSFDENSAKYNWISGYTTPT